MMGSRLLGRLLRRGANDDRAAAGGSSEPPSRSNRPRITHEWDEHSAGAPLPDDTWDNASTIAPSQYSMPTAVRDDASVITKKPSSDSLATIRKTDPEDCKHESKSSCKYPQEFTGLPDGKNPKEQKNVSKSSYKYPQDLPKLPDGKNWVRSPVPTFDASPTIDPLIAAIRYNSTRSPLLRLPDKVLTRIMRYLDGPSMYSARHTSRTFLRLFSSDEFESRQANHPYYPEPWMSQATVEFNAETIEYHRRDAYCPACAHIRRQKHGDPRYQALFHQRLRCAACAEEHPAAVFSAWQRREPDDSRICIGHEGYFRVCEHRTISWLDVQEWVVAVAHLDAYGVNAIRGKLCRHADHISRCDGRTTFGSGELEFHLNSGNRDLYIIVDSRQHLPGLQDPVSSLDIRRALDAAQEAGGKYLGPLPRPGATNHMGTFDPNNCICLTYSGSESVEMPLGRADQYGCRASTLEGEKTGLLEGSHRFKSICGRTVARTPQYICTVARCYCCMMTVRHQTVFALRPVNKDNVRKVDPAWFRAVSPESYEMTEDWESRHVLWCPDARCRNYHGSAGIDRFWGWKQRPAEREI